MTFLWKPFIKYFGSKNCINALILMIILALLESLILTVLFLYSNISTETFEICEKTLNISLVVIVFSYLFYSKKKLNRQEKLTGA